MNRAAIATLALGAAMLFPNWAAAHLLGGDIPPRLDDEERDRLTRETLPLVHDCPQVAATFRAQDMTEDEFDAACNLLKEIEDIFHTTIQTDTAPPTRERDTDVDILAFSSVENMYEYYLAVYGERSGGVSFGGIYIFSAIPSIILYVKGSRKTLAHEYTHHLEFRFNRGECHPFIHEGLAEYISSLRFPDFFTRSTKVIGDGSRLPLLTDAWAYKVQRREWYAWAYLAFRFLFEEYPRVILTIYELIRSGNSCNSPQDGYVNDVFPTLDDDFHSWLREFASITLEQIEPITLLVGEGNQTHIDSYFLTTQVMDITDISLSVPYTIEHRERDYGPPHGINVRLVVESEIVNVYTSSTGRPETGWVRNSFSIRANAPGTVEVTVTATTRNGESATQTFTVTVVEALQTRDIAVRDAVSTVEGETAINLENYYTGPALSEVEFTVASNKPDVARVAVRDGRLIITAVAVGEADITLRSVYHGRETTQTFTIAVTGACPSWLCRSGWRWLLWEGSMATVTRDDCDGSDGYDGDFDNATTLALNGQQSGSICPTGDVDYFRIDIEPGALELNITGSLDAFAEVHTEHGQQIQRIYGPSRLGNEYGGVHFRFFYDAVLFVLVSGYDGATGDYTIHAEFTPPDADDHGNSLDDATTLALDGQHSGRIDPQYDADYFRVDVTESGTLTVYTTGSFDTFGRLYSGIGTRIAWDQNSGEGTNFRIERRVYAGTYYVAVESEGRSATGDYTIHAEFEPN